MYKLNFLLFLAKQTRDFYRILFGSYMWSKVHPYLSAPGFAQTGTFFILILSSHFLTPHYPLGVTILYILSLWHKILGLTTNRRCKEVQSYIQVSYMRAWEKNAFPRKKFESVISQWTHYASYGPTNLHRCSYLFLWAAMSIFLSVGPSICPPIRR